jgi:transcriptional regulator with XRE-family HTH domain
MSKPMTLSDRLRRLLADRGCSIREAAALAGMENQQVWRIVTGKVENPGYLTVQRIVEAVGGTMAELAADDPQEEKSGKSQ